jgi:hypothetical protein
VSLVEQEIDAVFLGLDRVFPGFVDDLEVLKRQLITTWSPLVRLDRAPDRDG